MAIKGIYKTLLEHSQRLQQIEHHMEIAPAATEAGQCGSILKKKELLYFLYTMMEEGIFMMDNSNPAINRRYFQQFVESHFSYAGRNGQQVPVCRASRHFSEAKGFTYRDGHLQLLDKLIRLLEARKERLLK